jgi:hypothetical protein
MGFCSYALPPFSILPPRATLWFNSWAGAVLGINYQLALN